MYLLASQLRSFTIISLQTGAIVAEVVDLVIHPANLEVVAYKCTGANLPGSNSVLLTRDIRQIAQGCLIVDTIHDISEAEDIVRLQELLKQDFHLVSLSVVTESKRKLGRIQDYTINIATNMVQRLDVKQSLFRNFMVESLSIDRGDIVDITPKTVIVRDATVKAGGRTVVPAAPIIPD